MSIKITNAAQEALSVERLAAAITCDPETGCLRWRQRPVEHFTAGALSAEFKAKRWNAKYAGKPALTCRDPRGYAKGMLDQKMLWAHRVVVALRDGEWPDGEVDHINRNKSDNRPCNLRVVTHQQNAMNRVQGGGRGKRS